MYHTGPGDKYKANAAVLVRWPGLKEIIFLLEHRFASVAAASCLTTPLHMQVGMFQVLLLQRTPQRAYGVLQPLEPFMPFRDPSMGSSLFDLTVFHCISVS